MWIPNREPNLNRRVARSTAPAPKGLLTSVDQQVSTGLPTRSTHPLWHSKRHPSPPRPLPSQTSHAQTSHFHTKCYWLFYAQQDHQHSGRLQETEGHQPCQSGGLGKGTAEQKTIVIH